MRSGVRNKAERMNRVAKQGFSGETWEKVGRTMEKEFRKNS
jgi:hypothetical protein